MKKIYIIHENTEWTIHLTRRLDELGLPYEEWHLDKGVVDLTTTPPEGVFYNRMSASSHTRGHRFAPELTEAVLAWLERHGRKVLMDLMIRLLKNTNGSWQKIKLMSLALSLFAMNKETFLRTM
ncbi:hypothetical protein EDD69_106123 [Thermolongibacillus altinsuensis]|uniref:Uncharacterized protein n=1 Tax=Thermolongibacillus altinsuensis TaxID=575256 RepID=A0A4R1QHU3_9BACL|nr:hypothetical protein EDD69_106123 [Thermolongibacillus altinsuensis]